MTDIAASSVRDRPRRLFAAFERWPAWLFYAPVFVQWFWLAARYRGLTLPTIANTPPALSGFLGESKSGALMLLGAKGRAHLPPFSAFAVSATGDAAENARRAGEALSRGRLDFPLVAKPDVGQNGAGVKIVRDQGELARYLAAFPRGATVILQKYIAFEGEAGIVYVRHPAAEKGRIPSLTLKYFPTVTGNGASTLRELILTEPRAGQIAPLYFARHKAHLDDVVPAGEQVRLVSVGNHCRGAIFRNSASHITPRLEAALDAIAKEIPGFHFGRFDVRFPSLADLERGENFAILEINGADSEMTHIWDVDETIAGAYRTLFGQYRTIFEIGAANRARGARAATPAAFIRAWWETRKLFAKYAQEE
jgi:hypothetical protein